jgi:hypothetical protein
MLPADHPHMTTIDGRQVQSEREAVFDWRFEELRRIGLPPNAAWLLASDSTVEVRQAERLLAGGCQLETLLEILL